MPSLELVATSKLPWSYESDGDVGRIAEQRSPSGDQATLGGKNRSFPSTPFAFSFNTINGNNKIDVIDDQTRKDNVHMQKSPGERHLKTAAQAQQPQHHSVPNENDDEIRDEETNGHEIYRKNTHIHEADEISTGTESEETRSHPQFLLVPPEE